jgi:hypothetical protein
MSWGPDRRVGGLTLAPGLYKWTSNVSISTDVTLRGGPNDVWILQIAGTLTEASPKKVTLTGGAQGKNVFWQTAGAVSIGTTALLEGTILSKTMVAMKTGASIDGRLLHGRHSRHRTTLSQSPFSSFAAVISPGCPGCGPAGAQLS